MPQGFEQFPPTNPPRAPDQPPLALKALIENYTTFGGSKQKLVDAINAIPGLTITQLQLGKQWAEYQMKIEICKIKTKAEYRKGYGADFSAARIKEIEKECEKIEREHKPSPRGMIGVDLGPLADALSVRVDNTCEVRLIHSC